ncbi:hypothetical protein SEA_DUSSY_64 [Mycobacterium phage Dussy]|nr:hypothetical protein SEA_DUSSY_64 [Mycobacterium phage Dussy]UJQ86984.1 hypothetical protein SEA_ABBYSHOES_65 [Mycobacterium phage Abbyshoes]
MFVKDLIEELHKFPELSTVFFETDAGDVIRVSDTAAVHVRYKDGIYGRAAVVTDDADDFGILLL